jgi:hypothetical protein
MLVDKHIPLNRFVNVMGAVRKIYLLILMIRNLNILQKTLCCDINIYTIMTFYFFEIYLSLPVLPPIILLNFGMLTKCIIFFLQSNRYNLNVYF